MHNLYLNVLFVHSWVRWVIVISLCVVLARSLYGFFKKTPYKKLDNISSIILIASTHIQVLLGLWLYFFLSPITTIPSTQNFMKDPVLRYWKIEHFFIMIVFLILVQTGRIMSKKTTISNRKHNVTALFSLIAFIVLMFGMPWSR